MAFLSHGRPRSPQRLRGRIPLGVDRGESGLRQRCPWQRPAQSAFPAPSFLPPLGAEHQGAPMRPPSLHTAPVPSVLLRGKAVSFQSSSDCLCQVTIRRIELSPPPPPVGRRGLRALHPPPDQTHRPATCP